MRIMTQNGKINSNLNLCYINQMTLFKRLFNTFSHIDQNGKANMVQIINKNITERHAVAKASIIFPSSDIYIKIKENNLKKGDILAVANLSGIMAAKKTHDLIFLCHPINISNCKLNFEFMDEKLQIDVMSKVTCNDKTGIEMEALTSVSIACLNIYDMCKALTHDINISNIHLVHKSGGKSGIYQKID